MDVEPRSTASRSTASRFRPHWPLALVLGAFALIRPIMRILLEQTGNDPSGPLLPLAATALVSLFWIGAVVLARTSPPPAPMATLAVAGVVYAVLAITLSAVLSPILLGQLSGPLANPLAIVPMLLTNLLWGLVCGAIAAGLQSALHHRPPEGTRR